LRDRKEIERIQALVIPPAWTNVWICPLANGHLQAVGVDARGRRQYRYHAEYREVRDATKYGRLTAFGAALPGIRARVEQDLKLPGLPRNKVLATIVRLLEATSARVGNEEYVRSNESFGLTTLRAEHAAVEGSKLRLRFKGKSGVEHDVAVTDKRVARIVGECQDLPGQELFQYLDESGQPCKVCSEDVNAYIREISGEDFTAKDFRTWNGTREALEALREAGAAETAAEAKKKIVEAVKRVAGRLGNRPATCRKYYIHPAILDAYLEGTIFTEKAAQPGSQGLQTEEEAALRIAAAYVPKPAGKQEGKQTKAKQVMGRTRRASRMNAAGVRAA
jgi:DNA topoisomerase-1